MNDKQEKPTRGSEPLPSIRSRAEKLVSLTRTEVSEMTPEDVAAVVHELQVHQIELEIQNEELRQAQHDLAESHDRYLDLFDFAPVGYLISDERGQILESNLTAASQLKRHRRDLVKMKFFQFATPDSGDRMNLFFQDVFSRETSQRCELELRRGDGSLFAARLESLAFGPEDGSQPRCRTALIDITGEREAVKWKEQADRLRDMVENLPAGAIFVEGGERLFLNRTD